MTAGRPTIPIEKQAILAKGDGIKPGGRRVVPKGSVVVVQGNVGKLPAFPHDELPEMPANLGRRGKIMWFRIWDNGPWLHPYEDVWWVETAATAADEIEAYDKVIAKQGLTVPGYASESQIVANPLIKEKRAAQSQIVKCLSMLGFSPTDRARLGLAEIKRQSGLQDLQNRTHGG